MGGATAEEGAEPALSASPLISKIKYQDFISFVVKVGLQEKLQAAFALVCALSLDNGLLRALDKTISI